MSSNLIENRINKHRALNDGRYPITISEISECTNSSMLEYCSILGKESLNPEELDTLLVSARGRIKTIRKTGAIAFLKIEDITGLLQLIATKSTLKNFKDLSNLDIGDIIQCNGQPCQSKAGENSLLIHNFDLLSKAIRPLPEKWEGLTDKTVIYNQRYLDLISNKESLEIFKIRSKAIQTLRKYLESQNFMEVETPILTSVNSGANAKPFVTHHNFANKDLYLRISPELNLKRLIVGGLDKVYEIGKSFRNEGVSSRHNPEFTMLEFYEAYASFDKLIFHAKSIIKELDNIIPENFSSKRNFTTKNIVQISMLDAVKNAYRKAFLGEITDDLKFDFSVLKKPIKYDRFDNINQNIGIDMCDLLYSDISWGMKLFNLFELIAEPFLSEDYKDGDKSVPVMITHHPVEISPLARRNDLDPRVCDRFELYLDGIEVANGYQELNDPKDQKERMEKQLLDNKKDPMDYDASFVEALEYGMPPTIGFGLGIDRIVQLLTGCTSIKDVILFPAT